MNILKYSYRPENSLTSSNLLSAVRPIVSIFHHTLVKLDVYLKKLLKSKWKCTFMLFMWPCDFLFFHKIGVLQDVWAGVSHLIKLWISNSEKDKNSIKYILLKFNLGHSNTQCCDRWQETWESKVLDVHDGVKTLGELLFSANNNLNFTCSMVFL